MTTFEIVQKRMATHFEISADCLQPDTVLQDLGLDSLAIIEFMLEMEKVFAIRMPEGRFGVVTFQDMVSLIDGLIAEQATD